MKMASSGLSHLKNIDEQFCQCPICLQQYREPKLLPCLHRYCSDCLKSLIEKTQGVTVAHCPECRDEFTITADGVDGFKTDFYMQNMIKYIQLQKSVEDKQLRECYGCSKKLNVTSYCFKCNGFLCKDCYDFYMTNNIVKNYEQNVSLLENLKSKHMTLEKLVDQKEAPRCQSHPEDLCRFCCRTCNDLPICVTCVLGRHKHHDINDVEIIAAGEREKLHNEITKLNQYREQMMNIPQIVDRVKEDIVYNVREKEENFTTTYESNIQTVKGKIEEIRKDYKLSQNEIQNNKERELLETRKQMNEEMKQIKIKYETFCDEIKEISRVKLNNLKHEEEELQKRREKLAVLEKDFHTFIKTMKTRQKERMKKLQEILQQINDVIERYKNLKTIGYSVIDTRNDWTAVQCIPDICKAIEPLSKDMKREFSELEILSRLGVNSEIIQDKKSPLNIKGIATSESTISGITCSGDGSIVITGCTSADYKSHITVINMKGGVLHRHELKDTCSWPVRYCSGLSKFKISSVSEYNEIGVFDIRDYSYIKKNISDVISSWPTDWSVSCVTTDPVNKHILVGGYDSRDVYVFDDQLNYHHTLTLPEMINYPRDLTVSGENLLVCDNLGMAAFVISMDGREGKLIHEFTKPDFEQDEWRPLYVCTDYNGFIYILRMTGINLTAGRRVVTQYTQDGRQLLATKQIDACDARCIVMVKTGMTEKLLVATFKSGKLYIYSII